MQSQKYNQRDPARTTRPATLLWMGEWLTWPAKHYHKLEKKCLCVCTATTTGWATPTGFCWVWSFWTSASSDTSVAGGRPSWRAVNIKRVSLPLICAIHHRYPGDHFPHAWAPVRGKWGSRIRVGPDVEWAEVGRGGPRWTAVAAEGGGELFITDSPRPRAGPSSVLHTQVVAFLPRRSLFHSIHLLVCTWEKGGETEKLRRERGKRKVNMGVGRENEGTEGWTRVIVKIYFACCGILGFQTPQTNVQDESV